MSHTCDTDEYGRCPCSDDHGKPPDAFTEWWVGKYGRADTLERRAARAAAEVERLRALAQSARERAHAALDAFIAVRPVHGEKLVVTKRREYDAMLVLYKAAELALQEAIDAEEKRND